MPTYEYAAPTFTLRNLAGDAPWPVPITCYGWPLPQFGIPHKVHWSREQIASIEFQNSVVIPEYEGFFSMRARLPFLISIQSRCRTESCNVCRRWTTNGSFETEFRDR